jgi:hypothetical protein
MTAKLHVPLNSYAKPKNSLEKIRNKFYNVLTANKLFGNLSPFFVMADFLAVELKLAWTKQIMFAGQLVRS